MKMKMGSIVSLFASSLETPTATIWERKVEINWVERREMQNCLFVCLTF